MIEVFPSRAALDCELLKGCIDRHLSASFKGLPERITVGAALAWLEVCQWNARAEIFSLIAEQMGKACREKGYKCSRTQSRAHLADALGISERTVWRLLAQKRYPLTPRSAQH